MDGYREVFFLKYKFDQESRFCFSFIGFYYIYFQFRILVDFFFLFKVIKVLKVIGLMVIVYLRGVQFILEGFRKVLVVVVMSIGRQDFNF